MRLSLPALVGYPHLLLANLHHWRSGVSEKPKCPGLFILHTSRACPMPQQSFSATLPLDLILNKMQAGASGKQRSAKQMMDLGGPSPNPHQNPFNLEPGKRISPLPSTRPLWKPVCLLKDSCMHTPAQTSNPPCPLIKPDLPVWMCSKGIMNTC